MSTSIDRIIARDLDAFGYDDKKRQAANVEEQDHEAYTEALGAYLEAAQAYSLAWQHYVKVCDASKPESVIMAAGDEFQDLGVIFRDARKRLKEAACRIFMVV